MTDKFQLGELFCGPGGLALGAGLASKSGIGNISLRHAWGVDKDVCAINTYTNNIVQKFGGEGICCDVFEFCKNEKKIKCINALAFGFPCNDFSMVGKRRGVDGYFGGLYRAGVAILQIANPLWFVAENVSGIHSADAGDTFENILDELSNAGKYGYELTVHLYKFEDYGVPQYRHRYIIVGFRKDTRLGKKYRVPAPTHKNQHISVQQCLTNMTPNLPNNERQHQTSRVIRRLQFIPPWHNAWFLEDMQKMDDHKLQQTLESLEWYKHDLAGLSIAEIRQRLEEVRLHCTKARMSHIYKRLDATKPAYTITGSGGGGTHVYHWREHRALTNRERARIQSIPDDFVFDGSQESVRKQIGMAVPPRGAKIIFESILKTCAGVEYDADPEHIA